MNKNHAPNRRTDVDHYDPDLRSFIVIDKDAIRAQTPSGPLTGLLLGVKDIIDVRGFPTTNGSAAYDETKVARDASVVAWFRSQGMTVVGKTALNEHAFGVSGYNPNHGAILNPRDRRRTAGGSSGGSAAAVAAGVVDVAIGTDTSGSVRIPAACCGVYGFKTANGSWPLDGVAPLASRYDSLGFFTADVDDLELLLRFDQPVDVGSLRVGRLGEDLEVPTLPEEHWTLFRRDVWAVHGNRFQQHPELYGSDLRWKLRLPFRGGEPRAEATLAAWKARFIEAVEGWDVLVGPVLDGDAPLTSYAKQDFDRDEFLVGERLLRHTPAYNELGWPALTCPTETGPLQIAARPGDEPAILAVARRIGLSREDTVPV